MIIQRILLALITLSITGCVVSPSVSQSYQTTSSSIENGATVQPSLSPTDYSWFTPTSPPLFVQWAKESKQWLKGSPCFAPCWSGITPTQTRVGEAINLLKNNPLIDPHSVQITRELCGSKNGIEVLNSRKIIWRWSISSEYDHEDGSISYSQRTPLATQRCGVDLIYSDEVLQDSITKNGIVSSISLNFSGPTQGNDNDFLLPTLVK